MTSTVRFFHAILNCVKALTGFDDTDNKFHNLFKNFSVSSISRALTSLTPILPTTPAFQVKIANFYLKREKEIAAVTSPPLANATAPPKQIDFSDDEDGEDPSPAPKRPKKQPLAIPAPPPPLRKTRQSPTSPPSANQEPANLTRAQKRQKKTTDQPNPQKRRKQPSRTAQTRKTVPKE